MDRRQFLQLGMSAPLWGWIDRTIETVWTMNTRPLKASAYYRKTIKALPKSPEPENYHGWGEKLNVTFIGGSKATFFVKPYDHYLLGVEGSGLLDIAAISGRFGTLLPLCFSGINSWKVYPWAQWGIGNRSNPLVPGRDYANSQWPFGTRLIWGPPEKWLGTFRNEMFCADVFGDPLMPENRVDLFAGEEIDFGLPNIRAEITVPWSGVSKAPVKGAQQCLNILEIPGADGKKLDEDDLFGDNTNFALGAFLGKYRNRFPWGLPKWAKPNDPEIYYRLRVITKVMKKENGN